MSDADKTLPLRTAAGASAALADRLGLMLVASSEEPERAGEVTLIAEEDHWITIGRENSETHDAPAALLGITRHALRRLLKK